MEVSGETAGLFQRKRVGGCATHWLMGGMNLIGLFPSLPPDGCRLAKKCRMREESGGQTEVGGGDIERR